MEEKLEKVLAEEEEIRKAFMTKVDQGVATRADIPPFFGIEEQKSWNDYFDELEAEQKKKKEAA